MTALDHNTDCKEDWCNVFVTLRSKVFECYMDRVSPEESKGGMISDVFKEMEDWCKDNCRFEWMIGTTWFQFEDKNDATLFRLTFI